MNWLSSSIFSATFLFASAGCAQESVGAFKFSERSACDSSEHDPYAPDKIQVTQTPNLTVDVSASFNCIAKAGAPSLQEGPGKIILGVRETFPPNPNGADVAAACNCTRELRFELPRGVRSGTIVVFQVDGRTAATASAP